MNVSEVLIAFFGSVTSIFAFLAAQRAKNVDRKTETNHGREPWQYLEMVMEVRDEVLDLKSAVFNIREAQHEATKAQADLHEALVTHTEQDSENFDSLADLIKEN